MGAECLRSYFALFTLHVTGGGERGLEDPTNGYAKFFLILSIASVVALAALILGLLCGGGFGK